jgi:hypothetical protein
MTTASIPADRPWATAHEVTDLVARFTDGTLPASEWTHRAHLTVALWYATHHPTADALSLMREGILRLNQAHGVPNTPARGYHETITRFYMHVVQQHLRLEPVDDDWADRANRVYQRLGARDLPLRHYSEARLKSAEARAGWVEPDLRQMP